jgi:glutathione synthase/RimK-type ligase-like ATP-grasp enzyme
MFVVFNAAGLAAVENFPVIIQEYVPHSDTMFKVYVLGGDVCVTMKKSLPRLTAVDDKRNWHFGRISQESPELQHVAPISDRIKNHMVELAQHLRHKFGLSLFDFDVVIKSDMEEEHLFVIDVNPFPGYSSMDHFNPRLLRHLALSIKRRK